MSRMTKTLQSVKDQWKDKIEHFGEAHPDLSSIEKDSIFQDDQSHSDGNPFHSTALEDDFSPIQTKKTTTPVRKTVPPSTTERAAKPRRVSGTPCREIAAKHRKAKEKGKPNESSTFKKPSLPPYPTRVLPKPTAIQLRKISEESDTPETSKSASVSASEGKSSTEIHSEQSNKKSEAEAQNRLRKSSGRVQQLQKVPEENDAPASSEDEETDNDSLTDEDSVYVPPSKKRSRSGPRPQEEEEEEGSPSSNASGQTKSRPSSSGRKSQSRKSSSGSPDTMSGVRRKQKVRNPIDLEVVLEAFQDFVEQYKETVDSSAVQKAIDHLSESFVEQLTEAIVATKELTIVKKKNIKINTAMNKKRSKLVDAKNELIQSEAKLRALEKEHKQLEQRITDLTQSTSFLKGLTELHTTYQAYCQEEPDEPQTYNSTSIPAMLLEARCMIGAEHQLQTVNAKLQKVLDSLDQE